MTHQEIDIEEVEPLPAWAGRVGQAGEPLEGESTSSADSVLVLDQDRGSSKRVLAVVLAVIIVSVVAGVLAGFAYVSV